MGGAAMLYGATFVSVACATYAAGTIYAREKKAAHALALRIDRLARSLDAKEETASLLRESEMVEASTKVDVSGFNPAKVHAQSGLKTPFWQVATVAAMAGAAIALASLWLVNAPFLQLGLAVGVAFFGLLFYVRRARRKWCDTFVEQLPDAIDVAVRSLKAGHPFVVSLSLVAEEMPAPVGPQFAKLAEQLSYGVPVENALDAMHKRVPADDLRYLAVALVIHDRTGGNLAHTLTTLSDVIRARFALRGKVRALSAEGRFTAKLMSAFPLVLYVGLQLIVPDYFDELWASGYALHLIAFCTVTTLVGNAVVNKMVEIKV